MTKPDTHDDRRDRVVRGTRRKPRGPVGPDARPRPEAATGAEADAQVGTDEAPATSAGPRSGSDLDSHNDIDIDIDIDIDDTLDDPDGDGAPDAVVGDAGALRPLTLGRSLHRIADDAAAQDWPAATLYVVATPIGNRADITVRALTCLARVDAVAAEDTRVARALLHHYGIDRPMLAAHRHNEEAAAQALVTRLRGGERVAYVSDAGTPGVSDPGARLVAAARDAGFRVIPIPGASALTTAWSAAGLPEGPVHFVGFLPSRAAQATASLKSLATVDAHLVFYEAPHRIAETLAAIGTIFAGRACVVARELTKRFETIHRGPAADAAAWLAADPQRLRGEFVVIIEAAVRNDDDADRDLARALPILDRLLRALSVSEAASLAAELTGLSRKALYAEALKRGADDEAEEGDDR